MAWSNPRIWIDGPHITAEQMNAVSDNLRETAPAKAQKSGDLFYATGANEIERIPIGVSGSVLTPSGGVPVWERAPTPITTAGDIVIGDADGDPVRLPVGTGNYILVARGTSLEWEEESYLKDWWQQDEWWISGSPFQEYDVTLSRYGGRGFVGTQLITLNTPMVICDTFTFESGTINVDINPLVIRARQIVLQGNTTIVARRNSSTRFPFGPRQNDLTGGLGGRGGQETPDPLPSVGVAQGHDGGHGKRGCGGGGGGGRLIGQAGNAYVAARDGQNAPSLDMDDIRETMNGRGTAYGGYGGAAPDSATYSGGCFIVAAQSINRTTNNYTLTINANGDSAGSNGRGGSGGGLVVVVIKNGAGGVTATANGGTGNTANVESGGFTYRASGDGGSGTAYVGTAFPE